MHDPAVLAALPGAESWPWFTDAAVARAPAWRNQVTLRSFEMLMEYEPGAYIERIGANPPLMVVARNDTLAVADEALAAYPCAHVCDWFGEHLRAARR